MELGEFVPSRVVEAVVRRMDLTDALSEETIATPDGVALAAGILDDLLARRTVAGRPGRSQRRPRLGAGGLGADRA